MIRMLLSHVFYTKIVNHEGEVHPSGCMSPQPWHVDTFIISMWPQSFSEEFICQNARLWESPHRAPYFQKYKAISCVSVQIILFMVNSGNNTSGFSCTRSSLMLPSDRYFLGPSKCIMPPLCWGWSSTTVLTLLKLLCVWTCHLYVWWGYPRQRFRFDWDLPFVGDNRRPPSRKSICAQLSVRYQLHHVSWQRLNLCPPALFCRHPVPFLQIFPKCHLPYFSGFGIVHQPFVAGDCLTSLWMDHGWCEMCIIWDVIFVSLAHKMPWSENHRCFNWFRHCHCI